MSRKKEIESMFPDVPPADVKQIEQTIAEGQDYMAWHIPEKTPVFRLFREQLKYISPLLWAAQFAALVIAALSATGSEPNLNMAQTILLGVAPLTALLAVPELIKDVLCDMSELENSCKNSGSMVLLLRLIAVGSINISVLSLLAGIFAATWNFGFFSLLLYGAVPFNCVNIISLGAIRLLKIKGRSAALAVSLLSAVTVFMLPSAVVLNDFILAISFAATTIILSVQIYKTLQGAEKGGHFAWN